MTELRTSIRTIIFSTMLTAIPLAGAAAQSAEDAAERLKIYSADQGLLLEWERLDLDGSDVTLVGARVGVDGEDAAPVGNVLLENVSREDKGYRITKISLPSYALQDREENFAFEMTGLTIGNVLLPDEALRNDYGGGVFYETAKIDTASLAIDGVNAFTLDDLHFEVAEPDGDKVMRFTGAAETFTADLSLMEDANQLAIVRALGYEQIEGELEMAGSWGLADGRIALSQFDLAFNNAGTLGISFELGGYTPELMASLRTLQKQIADNPEGDNAAQGLAMLGLLQQLSFHGAEIALIDDSLTGKLLEYVAAKQGMRAEDVANQAKAVLPFVLAQLNNPELTAQATQAVSTFLSDPQNLRIAANPPSPVPFALIMATAMATPTELTKSLAISIKAND